jgi:hypothetical protein
MMDSIENLHGAQGCPQIILVLDSSWTPRERLLPYEGL